MNKKNQCFIANSDRKLGDRYELIECLGDGSHGWVWKAQRLIDNVIVAVKIPKAQGSKNSELAEGKYLIDRSAHANVVSVFWMGRVPPEREWYAIELEYFPSNTLARLLDEGEQGFVSSYKRILDIYSQILAGVNYLHSLGISHGDIKPQNILVAGDLAKLTDFGSSLLPEDVYTRTHENGGTILYSAPELAGTVHREKNHHIFKGDIYSLGVLLYHLVTSRLPHDTLSQVIRYTPFPRPREINSSVSPAVEDFILRCLAFNPDERWDSLSEMSNIFSKVRQAQLDYQPIRSIPIKQHISQDWSSQTIEYLEKEEYTQAENIAGTEFRYSQDPYAFLLMVSATFKDGRYFDCLEKIESHAQMLDRHSPITIDLNRIALGSYLETRQVQKAELTLNNCLTIEGECPQLLLQKASILGAQARYEEASKILIGLNRDYPQRLAILKRLVLVFEQQRDISKVGAFLRAYRNLLPEDPWVQEKIETYNRLRF
jgi:eukaryotic-like serine/threonine-protein kinase